MAVPRLSMNDSDLYQRRQHHHPQPPLPPVPTKITDPDDEIGDYAHVEPPQHTVTTTRFSDYSRTVGLPPAGPRSSAAAVARKKTMPLGEAVCKRCELGFEPTEQIVNSAGELWHPDCFVCAQCFQPFPEGIFYEFEGRKYCEHDFQVLFAPCCQQCNEFIIGRVIKAMNGSWHPACFRCNMCGKELADLGFIKHGNQALCHDCNARIRLQGTGRYMCHKCHGVIDGEPLRFRGELYHPYHFNCKACGIELDSRAREVKSRAGYTSVELNELYCLRCHDKMGIPICGACHRPIEERVVTALGKNWHVEHFVCAKCEKPFLGHRHYEKKGQAYCRTDYHMLFGNICFVCNYVVEDEVVRSLNKAWCPHHFACSLCDQPLTRKSKFFEMDMKPVCKKCYEKLPHELRRRLKRLHENEAPGMVTAEFTENE